MVWLSIRSGDQAGTAIELAARPVVIGRGEECELVLGDRRVSRRHAQVEPLGDGRCVLADLGSANGTFVDGERIAWPVLLQGGEEIVVGDTSLALTGSPERPAGAPGG